MITATAEYVFKKRNKKYNYRLELPDEPAAHDISLAISRAVMRERNTKRVFMGNHLPMYALSMKLFDIDQVKLISDGELLAQTARIVLPKGNPDPRKDAYLLANQRNEETKPIVLTCDMCDGKGELENWQMDIEVEGEANLSNSNECPKCKGEGFIIWRLTNRVGRVTNSILVIDIDGHDENNMKFMKAHAETIYGYPFQVAKTGGGYWLCGTKKYDNVDDWLFDNCKLLKPDLERRDLKSYIKKLIALDESTKNLIGGKDALTKKIKESELYNGFGEFDVIFTLISIKVKKHTLRDSKKFKEDKIEIIE